MSYPLGEALVLTQCQAVTGFSSTNTAQANWTVLNSGLSDHYIIVKPGKFNEDPVDNLSWIYQTIIQVWQWYTDDGTTATNLEGYVQAVKDRFTKYRKLVDATGKITDSRPIGGSEMQEMWKKDGGLAWLKQDVIIEWREQDIVTYAE